MIVSVRKRRTPARTSRPQALRPRQDQPQTVQPRETALLLPGEEQREVTFPDGLLGLPHCQHFVLSAYKPEDGSATPFFLLQCQDEDISFPLIEPRLCVADYHFTVNADVLAYLKANTAEELSTLAIVTVRDHMEDTTMNLQGPLVMNLHGQLGLQFVLEHFPVRYPLFAPANEKQAAAK
jgi:flagellar assembly factor FliW